jgi:hypothetical protein
LETIEEVHVATSMYDASMGEASGAHVETTTKYGTNSYHGQAYEYFQNNTFDAAPLFWRRIRSLPERRRYIEMFSA